MVCQKAERIKISFAFRQHLIIAACYVSKMYKVELRDFYRTIVICIYIYTYCGIRVSERLVGREMKRTEMFDLTTEDCYKKPTVGDQANE